MRQILKTIFGFKRMVFMLMVAFMASTSEAFFLISVGRIALQSVTKSTETTGVSSVILIPLSLLLSLGLRFYLNRIIATNLSKYLEEIRSDVSQSIFRSLQSSDVSVNASTISHQMGALSLQTVDRARDIFEGAVGGITLFTFGVAAVVTEPFASLLGFGLMVIALFMLKFLKGRFSIASADKAMSDKVLASKIDGLFSLKDEIRAHGLQPEVANWSNEIVKESAFHWREHELMGKNIPLVYVSVMYSMLALVSIAIFLFPLADAASLAGISLILLRAQNYGNRLQVGVLAVIQYQELISLLKSDSVHPTTSSLVEQQPLIWESSSVSSISAKAYSSAPFVLRFTDVTFSYDGVELDLASSSFNLRSGEVLGVVGPSGSGKTTIAKLSCGIVTPTSGEVLICGRPSDLISDFERRDLINYLPQSPGRIVGTVEENISMFDDRLATETMNFALAELGLLDELGPDTLLREIGSSSSTISGGQMQRLMLCRWAVRNRPLSVLDEPTSALDGDNTDIVGNLLRQMSKGSAVLLITHSEKLLPYCDRVLELDSK